MSTIEIFEAAGCCATRSVVVDEQAIQWNADREWARKHNVSVQRYSLAKQPQQFLNNPRIKAFLDTAGMQSLPVTLLNGELVLAGKLPSRGDIARWAGIPVSDTEPQPHCCTIPRMP